MDKKILYYFPIISIIIFSFILCFISPNISRTLTNSKYWKSLNCQKYSDQAKDKKSEIRAQGIIDTNELKNRLESYLRNRNLCNRKKIMFGLEYASIVTNLCFGIINFFLFIIINKNQDNNNFYMILIIVITSIISFILTLLYTIFSTYIFINDIAFKEDFEDDNKIPKLNSDRALAYSVNQNSNYYNCYQDFNDKDSFYIKYKDLGKNIYNKINNDENYDVSCIINNLNSLDSICSGNYWYQVSSNGNYCRYIYYIIETNSNKQIYNKWLCSIIFSLLIINANIILFISAGLLLKKNYEYIRI